MDMKWLVGTTCPTGVVVTRLHICFDVGITHLFAFLILIPLDVLVLDFLDVKASYLNHDAGDWQDGADVVDDIDMRPDLRLHRRREPAVGPSPVVEAGFAIAETASACTSRLPTSSHKLRNIVTQCHLGTEQLLLFC